MGALPICSACAMYSWAARMSPITAWTCGMFAVALDIVDWKVTSAGTMRKPATPKSATLAKASACPWVSQANPPTRTNPPISAESMTNFGTAPRNEMFARARVVWMRFACTTWATSPALSRSVISFRAETISVMSVATRNE